MRLALFLCKCEKHGKQIKFPTLSHYNYGDFILYSQVPGTYRYLNALEDSSYDEFCIIVEGIIGSTKNENEVADIVRENYGKVVCDPDEFGNYFSINSMILCNNSCKSSLWGIRATEPLEFTELEIPHVSHKLWASLSRDEKIYRSVLALKID